MKVNRYHLFILLILVVMINSSQGTAKIGFPYESASTANPSLVNPYWLKYTPDRSLVTKDDILYLFSRDKWLGMFTAGLKALHM